MEELYFSMVSNRFSQIRSTQPTMLPPHCRPRTGRFGFLTEPAFMRNPKDYKKPLLSRVGVYFLRGFFSISISVETFNFKKHSPRNTVD